MTSEAKTLLAIGLVTMVILVGGVFFLSKGISPASTTNPSNVSADNNLLIKPNSHVLSTSVKGASDSARVNVVEFGDYQCPACGAAYPVTKKVIADYRDKINFVFRNFPLPMHKNAQIAAEAAEAAGVQGKFWEMHDKLYESQSTWGDSDQPMDLFVTYAQQIGIDVNKFKDEVSANKYSTVISQDQSDGNSLGVNATPTFYINGQKFEGVPGYNDFKIRIESALSGK